MEQTCQKHEWVGEKNEEIWDWGIEEKAMEEEDLTQRSRRRGGKRDWGT